MNDVENEGRRIAESFLHYRHPQMCKVSGKSKEDNRWIIMDLREEDRQMSRQTDKVITTSPLSTNFLKQGLNKLGRQKKVLKRSVGFILGDFNEKFYYVMSIRTGFGYSFTKL